MAKIGNKAGADACLSHFMGEIYKKNLNFRL